ncbi:MAG: hypothetical protein LBS37_01810 [Treponema sp.]|jgi:tetratricopeptide (TPR) repeat protein|nr:hypothetical protein [Treponema sp.]
MSVQAKAIAPVVSAEADTPPADGLSLEEAIEESAADIASKLPEGTRVAIAAFESPHGNLSGYIMDELKGALVDGSLEVADRNNLEYVYRELNFQMSGDVDDKSAQAIGRFQGARYVITGQLLNTGGGYRYRLNGINVETAIQESSTRLNVRNDRAFKDLLAALQTQVLVTRTADYGTGEKAPPRTSRTFLDQGITSASRGDYDLAIADYTRTINLNPNDSYAYNYHGYAYLMKDDESRARADFLKALQIDPNNAAARKNLNWL